jgi:hypothetical protein
MNEMALYETLQAACDKIADNATRQRVDYLIDQGRDNATFTIETEKAAPAEDWERLFKGTIELLLSCEDFSEEVRTFFKQFKIYP